jgi:outer membrane lipoprotein-sorting protein
MIRRLGVLALAVGLGLGGFARAEEPVPLISAGHKLAPDAPAWRDLVEKFAQQPDTTADFEERRVFPFRREPVVLKGEVRVSRPRGLSLHYTAPEEHTIVFDDRGMIVRDPAGQKAPPPDPRANVANEALLLVLRLDFAALAKGFELYGRREGDAWSLGLVPRDEAVKRAIGDIHVGGENATVRRIELRRSAKQHITILIEAPRSTATFTAEELARFFR